MIQRIQSLFLFAAFVCSVVSLFVPFVYFESSTNEVLLYAFHYTDIDGKPIDGVGSTLPLGLIVSFSALASLATVFLFKNRKLQLRISLYNILLNVGAIGLIYFYSSYAASANVAYALKMGSVLPIVAAIFVLLAFRTIRQDDALVKSLDRIR